MSLKISKTRNNRPKIKTRILNERHFNEEGHENQSNSYFNLDPSKPVFSTKNLPITNGQKSNKAVLDETVSEVPEEAEIVLDEDNTEINQ